MFHDFRKEQILIDVGNMAEWQTLLIIFLTFTAGNFYDGLDKTGEIDRFER